MAQDPRGTPRALRRRWQWGRAEDGRGPDPLRPTWDPVWVSETQSPHCGTEERPGMWPRGALSVAGTTQVTSESKPSGCWRWPLLSHGRPVPQRTPVDFCSVSSRDRQEPHQGPCPVQPALASARQEHPCHGALRKPLHRNTQGTSPLGPPAGLCRIMVVYLEGCFYSLLSRPDPVALEGWLPFPAQFCAWVS